MTMYHPQLAEVVRRDPRYSYEAYEFVFSALAHTQQALGRALDDAAGAEAEPSHHVSGPELLHGIRELALQEFGLMARVVFRLWGVERTDDFGRIVFNLVEAQLMSKTDRDSLDDFRGVYDFDEALVRDYHIRASEEA